MINPDFCTSCHRICVPPSPARHRHLPYALRRAPSLASSALQSEPSCGGATKSGTAAVCEYFHEFTHDVLSFNVWLHVEGVVVEKHLFGHVVQQCYCIVAFLSSMLAAAVRLLKPSRRRHSPRSCRQWPSPAASCAPDRSWTNPSSSSGISKMALLLSLRKTRIGCTDCECGAAAT